MARPAVHGTFSQPGPSRPAAAVRLARTICRTKCVHAGNASLHVATSAHGKRDMVAGRGNLESKDSKNNPVCAPDGQVEKTSGSQSIRLPVSALSISQSGHRATQAVGASHRSSFKSAPLSSIAPRLASRWTVALTAAAEYRPCSAVSRDGDASVARHEQSTRLFCRQMRARHNPSLNHRTRYGGLSWPGLRYAVHFRSPGQAIPPHRAG